jgi:ketol-acid reductoisomerase
MGAPPRFFTQADADPTALDGHAVAVLGYGTLGRSVALNLRDSGLTVIVGNIADSYRDQAVAEGFAPVGIAEAAAAGDEVFVLLPDEVIGECFDTDIAPQVRKGAAVCFASGYALAYDLVTPPPEVDVVLMAPRMGGALVRQTYLDGSGFYSYLGIEADTTGKALARLLALAAAAGSLRRGALMLSAAQEALIDLFVEQTFGVYLGLGVQLAVRVGVEAGLPAEAMVLELYKSGEMAKTIDGFKDDGFWGSLLNHGITALYGGFIRTGDVDNAGMEAMYRSVLADIQSGGFAARFQRELADGYPTVTAIRELISGDNEIATAEANVRAALGG